LAIHPKPIVILYYERKPFSIVLLWLMAYNRKLPDVRIGLALLLQGHFANLFPWLDLLFEMGSAGVATDAF
jgi:hypothetical protein